MDPLFPDIPEDLGALSADELRQFIDAARDAIRRVAADPASYVTDDMDADAVLATVRALHAAIPGAQAALDEMAPEVTVDDLGNEAAALAADFADDTPDDDTDAADAADDPPAADDADDDADDAADDTEPEAETAAAVPAVRAAARPARARRAAPASDQAPVVALTAAIEAAGAHVGQEVDARQIAEMMIRRRRDFGHVAEGATENITIARADWKDAYPSDRVLGADPVFNQQAITAALDPSTMRAELDRRIKGALTASGGLCAPVTPYYSLMQLSGAERPVRAALPSFGADRGGINAATPASLASIEDAISYITAEQDAAGGTSGTKTCQVIDCPPFVETDVAIIAHCLQFGNLGARTYPELVEQWNQLVLAAHARTAETALLDGISGASTAVTANSLGLGATATLPSQVLAAAAGYRSRHRMATDAILRVLLPSWVLELLVSDMYRSQFDRFDMSAADFVAVLRRGNVEPSFYLDSATGKGQVFGSQSAGDLLPFPADIVWYLYSEGSFLYLDGGTLELGLVRDSVLNATNDFQIFGETFENVAFVGVESLEVTTTTCDSGTVSLPHAVECPIDYADLT